MNETIRTILSRRSIRSYSDRAVEPEKIDIILKCGKYAPTGKGIQPWHFTVVKNRALLDKISKINSTELYKNNNRNAAMSSLTDKYDNFRGAPMAIIISGMVGEKYSEADCANATTIMSLAAHSLGLGSLYIASFRPAFTTESKDELYKELGIPKGYSPIFALALGYIKEPPAERAQRREGTVNYID